LHHDLWVCKVWFPLLYFDLWIGFQCVSLR
jgi:hypothetical protein